MRPSTILKKTARPKKKKKTPSRQKYWRDAVSERKRAIDNLFGSQGPASPVRKIDPKTGEVVAIIEPH